MPLLLDQSLNKNRPMKHKAKRNYDELALVKAAQANPGGPEEDRLCRENEALCISIAKRFKSPGLTFEDMLSYARAGFLIAIRKFDDTKSCKLSTYAVPWIQQAIGRGIDVEGRLIHIQGHVLDNIRKYEKLHSVSNLKVGRDLTREELLKEFKKCDLDNIQRGLNDTLSLDMVYEEDDSSLTMVDRIASPNLVEEEVVEKFNQEFRKECVKELLTHMRHYQTGARLADILSLRYGLEDGIERSFQQVCDDMEKLGHRPVSRQRIQGLEKDALRLCKCIITLRPHLIAALSEIFLEIS